MSEPLKHHYLPEFYLRLWQGADKKICRYHRPRDRVVAHRVSPSGTAFEKQLYTLHSARPEDRQSVEKSFFSKAIDDAGAVAMRALLARPPKPIAGAERESWVRFLLAFALRNPDVVAQIRAAGSDVLRREFARDPQEFEAIRGDVPEATLLEFVERRAPKAFEDLGIMSLPGAIADLRLGQAIWEMHWSIMDLSAGQVPLLASDRPILIAGGLGDPTCYIVLPVGPRSVFFASRDPAIAKLVCQRHSSTELALSLNTTFVSQAMGNVYGVDDEQLDFVEAHLRRVDGIRRRVE